MICSCSTQSLDDLVKIDHLQPCSSVKWSQRLYFFFTLLVFDLSLDPSDSLTMRYSSIEIGVGKKRDNSLEFIVISVQKNLA